MPAEKDRVLCVDANDDTRSLLTFLLEQAGYQVTGAGSVAEGLRLARGSSFSLYLLEQKLPDGTGLELCRRLRADDPLTPVLFFSTLAQARDRQAGIAAGAEAYLLKPNDLDRLPETVAELIARGRHGRFEAPCVEEMPETLACSS